jgi:hypothetical protein
MCGLAFVVVTKTERNRPHQGSRDGIALCIALQRWSKFNQNLRICRENFGVEEVTLFKHKNGCKNFDLLLALKSLFPITATTRWWQRFSPLDMIPVAVIVGASDSESLRNESRRYTGAFCSFFSVCKEMLVECLRVGQGSLYAHPFQCITKTFHISTFFSKCYFTVYVERIITFELTVWQTFVMLPGHWVISTL